MIKARKTVYVRGQKVCDTTNAYTNTDAIEKEIARILKPNTTNIDKALNGYIAYDSSKIDYIKYEILKEDRKEGE